MRAIKTVTFCNDVPDPTIGHTLQRGLRRTFQSNDRLKIHRDGDDFVMTDTERDMVVTAHVTNIAWWSYAEEPEEDWGLVTSDGRGEGKEDTGGGEEASRAAEEFGFEPTVPATKKVRGRPRKK